MKNQQPAVLVFVLLLAIAAMSAAAEAAETEGKLIIAPRNSNRFQNTDCKKNSTCDLESVQYQLEDFTVVAQGEKNYGTRLFSSYTTRTSADLEKYVFVQFIRGCVYETIREAGGKVIVWHDVMREHFHHLKTFNHPVWQIDSIDDNPVYYSMDGKPLHYQYRWNAVAGSTDKKTEVAYGVARPWWPTLYVADRVGTAFNEKNWARNISLEFMTCLYKTEDVPQTAKPEDVSFGTPIDCFRWDSSFIYNFETAKYERQDGISSACAEQ